MSEPMPWATLVLPNPSDNFEGIKSVVNTAGIVVFCVVLFAFYLMIGGKLQHTAEHTSFDGEHY